MKGILCLTFTCGLLHGLAQNTQREINDQVWKPFIESFNERDTKRFMEIHSKDVVRSPRDAKTVWNWNEYYQRQEQGDQKDKSTGSKRLLELRFTERISSSDLAIEVGIFKTTSIQNNGIARSFYGRFHVILRKENDVWRILVDTDSSEGNSINEEDFLAAAAME